MNLTDTKRWISVIHVARKELSLDDEAYRAILSGAGVASSKDLATAEQFDTVMRSFVTLGFRYRKATKKIPLKKENVGFLSIEQVYYAKGLADLVFRSKTEKSFRAFVKRQTGVDDIRFIPRSKWTSLILPLRKMAEKSGFNPDGPHGEATKKGGRS